MTNKYNERYKDMTNEEKVREVEDKFAEELKADRAKHEALRSAKADMEVGATRLPTPRVCIGLSPPPCHRDVCHPSWRLAGAV